MSARLQRLVAAQAVAIALLAAAAAYLGYRELRSSSGPESAGPPAQSASGLPVVELSEALFTGSGIEVQALPIVRLATASEYPGVVVPVQGLLDEVQRWRGLEAESRALEAELRRAQAELTRVKALFGDERNASERDLQAAQATWLAARARSQAARQASAAQRTRLASEWGLDPVEGGQRLAALARQRSALLQVALPAQETPPERLEVRIAGSAAGREARLLGAAAQPAGGLSGATFSYLSDGEGLRAGARLIAAAQQPSVEGVLVPATALVWHGGRVWVYLRRAESGGKAAAFSRRDVTAGEWRGDGWFTAALPAGAAIVVSGAQLLLSEEQRGLVKNENRD